MATAARGNSKSPEAIQRAITLPGNAFVILPSSMTGNSVDQHKAHALGKLIGFIEGGRNRKMQKPL
jgi:hypothetical protein